MNSLLISDSIFQVSHIQFWNLGHHGINILLLCGHYLDSDRGFRLPGYIYGDRAFGYDEPNGKLPESWLESQHPWRATRWFP